MCVCVCVCVCVFVCVCVIFYTKTLKGHILIFSTSASAGEHSTSILAYYQIHRSVMQSIRIPPPTRDTFPMEDFFSFFSGMGQ